MVGNLSRISASSLTAGEAGTAAAWLVAQGKITVAQVGDAWQRYADRSHASGVAFLKAYDAAGGER